MLLLTFTAIAVVPSSPNESNSAQPNCIKYFMRITANASVTNRVPCIACIVLLVIENAMLETLKKDPIYCVEKKESKANESIN